MTAEAFPFNPAQVPQDVRGSSGSRYVATVEKVHDYFATHKDVQSVEIELGDVSMKSAVASFRNVISKRYSDSLRPQQRGGRLYISRRD